MMAGQTGMMAGQPGMMAGQTGMMGGQTGLMAGQTGMMGGQTGLMGGGQQPGMMNGGMMGGGMMSQQLALYNPHQSRPPFMNQGPYGPQVNTARNLRRRKLSANFTFFCGLRKWSLLNYCRLRHSYCGPTSFLVKFECYLLYYTETQNLYGCPLCLLSICLSLCVSDVLLCSLQVRPQWVDRGGWVADHTEPIPTKPCQTCTNSHPRPHPLPKHSSLRLR